MNVSKKQRINDAAMELFMERGVDQTSVNAIVKRANVAKGTFYIYYKDKEELIRQAILMKSITLIDMKLKQSRTISYHTHTSWTREFIKAMIHYYEEHPNLLRMINCNPQFRLSRCTLLNDELFQSVELLDEFLLHLQGKGDTRNALNKFFLMLAIIGSGCYQSIILKQPDTIDEIRDLLICAAIGLCQEESL